MYRAFRKAAALTCKSQGRLCCSAPYKGLRPLRRFVPTSRFCGKLNIIPYDRFTPAGKAVFLFP